MDSFFLAIGSALWLGILTSISPCPLATNIAAISFISKRVDKPRFSLIAGLLYTIGRTLAYFLISLIIVKGLLSVFEISQYLQQNALKVLGPLLIITGILLIDFIPWPWMGGSGISEKMQQKVEKLGLAGALVLGVIFALAFCPISAALFFGSLIPLSVSHQSVFLLPSLYGLGTALPVVVFSVILAFAANKLSKAFNVLSKIEKWMRRLTAIVFIGIGVYYTITALFGVSL